MISTPLSFRPAGEIFQGAGNIRTSQDSSRSARNDNGGNISDLPLKACHKKQEIQAKKGGCAAAYPPFSAINLGLRDLSRVGDLQIIPFIGVKKSSFPENL